MKNFMSHLLKIVPSATTFRARTSEVVLFVSKFLQVSGFVLIGIADKATIAKGV
jgi:hypothetical protein